MDKRIAGLVEIADRYKAIFCDVWGVVHNGQSVYTAATSALQSYREAGGRVVLLTNSPRPDSGVIQQLNQMGVDPQTYDAVVTSGDATRQLIREAKGPLFHLGPDRDRPLFEGMDQQIGDAGQAETIVCTGLFDDEVETPDDYRQMLSEFVARGTPLICANPDLVVERGEKLIWCAGALAQLYQELGGTSLLAGKPHPPIYRLARTKLEELDPTLTDVADILAIGDGLPTDVAGADANGHDLLYISAGIHHSHYGGADNPDPQQLIAFMQENNASMNYWMPRLQWQGMG